MTIDVENFSNRSSEPRPIAQGSGLDFVQTVGGLSVQFFRSCFNNPLFLLRDGYRRNLLPR